MRFSSALLFALVSTTSIVSANPMPVKWNDKDMEAGYKFGAVACGIGAYVCNQNGMQVAQSGLVYGGFCCSAAAAAVTASQADGWIAAANKIGAKAVVAKNGVIAGGKLAVTCTIKVCQVVAAKARGQREVEGGESESLLADRPADFDVARYADLETDGDDSD
ncbi:hypothetical protein BJ878DRAFT_546793 [Calycina marina]|uniref:Uncharacterized protein n=1 Tax=Calycina marina TaxID=1763456 RepID=A0A9P8CAW4_9HELO|nr:hypothetical protein BJ878DRAFT_546793 [Calycina marina]